MTIPPRRSGANNFNGTARQTESRFSGVLNELQGDEEQKWRRDFLPILEFNMNPKEIYDDLDRFIIGQEDGKQAMAVRIAAHYKMLAVSLIEQLSANGRPVEQEILKVDLARLLDGLKQPINNIMFVGPSGCGKTYTIDRCSKLISIPFITEDMGRFSEVGYVGLNADEILLHLLDAAKGNPYLAMISLAYLDEIDKKAGGGTIGRDVSGSGVQNNLLTIVGGSKNMVEYQGKNVELSTRNILWIAGGAFEGQATGYGAMSSSQRPSLENIVVRRLKNRNNEMTDDQARAIWASELLTEDFIEYGMERQLMRRFPARVVYKPLTEQDLSEILQRSADSPVSLYQAQFAAWSIKLEILPESFDTIAQYAAREGIGASGLTTIMDKVIRPYQFERWGQSTEGLTITKEMVEEALR